MFGEDNEIISKIGLLYELGVIGLKFTSKYIKSRTIASTLCFVFNEGMYPFNRMKLEILKGTENVSIVLNPIFAKRLFLHYNTTEILGAYGWEYLRDNHIRKKGIDRI